MFRRLCTAAGDAPPITNVERSVNKVTLLGRVGRDPEVRGSAEHPVVTFTMATSEQFQRKGQEKDEITEKTSWHKVAVFKPGLRQLVTSFVRKGARVYLTGRLDYSVYVDRAEVTHQTITVIADDMIFLAQSRSSMSTQPTEEAVGEPNEV